MCGRSHFLGFLSVRKSRVLLAPSPIQKPMPSRLPSWDWQYSNSHKLEAHSNKQHPVYSRGPRAKANVQCFFLDQVPLYSCAVESVLWESCPVTRAHLRVRACADRLLSPSHHQLVSSLRPRDMFGWTDHGAVTASSAANTTKYTIAARTQGPNK